ncbi:EG45-like domain containing protein [Magnolia sinica]|uniref:EG45-like domain containing protein n=1 Tax=Magnolia sinica TaxID=86752 RepID=UPI002657BEE3|nr:EG45-like domain containing protein [Magnolia sinica]
MEKRLVVVMVMVMVTVLGFISVVTAVPGTATYYDPPYVPSSCYGNQDNGVMIAGASDTIWGNRAACGRHYSVKCTGQVNTLPKPCKETSVVVRIVDYCPSPGCNGTINLSRDAFNAIANLQAGKIKIDYQQV